MRTMRWMVMFMVIVMRNMRVEAVEQASICVSVADCCSLSSEPTMTTARGLPCCGAALQGPEALRCGDDGFCYRGSTPCRSSMDDPLCNIPGFSSDVEGSIAELSMSSWRRCRSDSVKLQALRDETLYGGTPLLVSALHARSESVQWLLQEGADVHARGRGGATALHMAALTPAGTPMLQLLLANGASPNVVDEFGYTPLHRTIQSGSVEGATLLLSSGANATRVAPGRETPLHLAAYENDRDMALLLLAFGADPFERNDRGVTGFEVGLFDLSGPPRHMM